MTFNEFKSAVFENLGPDAQRAGTGLSGLDAFRLRQVTNAMAELQRFIVPLRTGHTSTLTVDDLTTEGRASYGTFAAGARPREFWIKAGAPWNFDTTYAVGDEVWFPGTGCCSLTVTGSGSADTDGTYPPVGDDVLFGRPHYYREGVIDITSRHLYWTGDEWVIEQYLDTTLYTGTAATDPWDATWSVTDGDAPAPTVAALTCTSTPVGAGYYRALVAGSGGSPLDAERWESFDGGCSRYRLDVFPWADRHQLICGDVADERYHYSIGPDAKTYYIHPGLTAATLLELVWDGIKTKFADSDQLADAWDDKVAECVAEYVKWKIVHQYDKDAVSRAKRHEDEYIRLRRGLYLDVKEVTNA